MPHWASIASQGVREPDLNEANALAEQRQRARAARDFALADELRNRIAAAGFEVHDTPGGYELVPAGAPTPAVSVLVDLEGWPEDAARFLVSLANHRACTVEVIAVDRRAGDRPSGWADGWDGPAQTLDADATTGFGAARNLALAAATGAVVMLVDTSLEVTGDLLGALISALDDPRVAVAGPFGLTTADLFDYEERTTGDVAIIQGYCLAARRADLVSAGGVRESFTFYRNADIDVSLRLRTLGESVRRAVAVGAEHCRRHPHRACEATPPEERDRLSRRNMRRVHDRFLGRQDLTVS